MNMGDMFFIGSIAIFILCLGVIVRWVTQDFGDRDD